MEDRLELNDIDAIEKCAKEGANINPFTDVVISRRIDGEVVGAVVFSDYNGASIYIDTYFWMANCLSRANIAIVMDYVFNQCGCERMLAKVREDHVFALRINRKFGMKPIALIPGVYRNGVGQIIMKMERAECRWLALKDMFRKAA